MHPVNLPKYEIRPVITNIQARVLSVHAACRINVKLLGALKAGQFA